jgi:hypothetical protein
MKNALLTALIALTSIGLPVASHAQNSAPLGEDDFTIDEDSITMAPGTYSQTSTALVLNGSFSLGSDSLGGVFSSSYDWVSAPGFGFTMSITGPNPSLAFFVELYDDVLGFISTYEGSTFGVGSTPSVVELDFVSFAPGRDQTDLSSVDGFQFTWSVGLTPSTINASIENITVVPEPSTWALLGLGVLVTGAAIVRRRRRAA